jgi:hypothetical protein
VNALEFNKDSSSTHYWTYNKLFTWGRAILYSKVPHPFETIYNRILSLHAGISFDALQKEIFGCLHNPFVPEVFESVCSLDGYYRFFYNALIDSIEKQIDRSRVISYMQKRHYEKKITLPDYVATLLLEHCLLQGNFSEVEKLEKTSLCVNTADLSIIGTKSFVNGNMKECLLQLENYNEKKTKGKDVQFSSYKSVLYMFSLLKEGEADNYKKATAYSKNISTNKTHPYKTLFESFYYFCQFISGNNVDKSKLICFKKPGDYDIDFWNVYSSVFIDYMAHKEKAEHNIPVLEKLLDKVRSCGYQWMEMQVLDLIKKLKRKESKEAIAIQKAIGGSFLSESIPEREEWKLVLTALSSLKPKKAVSLGDASAMQDGTKRISWFISYHEKHNFFQFQPIEQVYNSKKGGWSEGRNVALKRLKHQQAEMPHLLALDIRAASYIKEYSDGYYGSVTYEFSNETILALIGHPNVFWTSTKTHVEIIEAKPELKVTEESKDTVRITLQPHKKPEDKFVTVKREEDPSKLLITIFSKEQEKIALTLGSSGIVVPKKAESDLLVRWVPIIL